MFVTQAKETPTKLTCLFRSWAKTLQKLTILEKSKCTFMKASGIGTWILKIKWIKTSHLWQGNKTHQWAELKPSIRIIRTWKAISKMGLLLTTCNSIILRTKGCHQDTSNGKVGNVQHRRIYWKGQTVCLVWQATSSILTLARMLSHLVFGLNQEPILTSVVTALLQICNEWTSLDLGSFPTNLRLSQLTKGVLVAVQVPLSTRESSTLKSQDLPQLPHRSRATTCPTIRKVVHKHQPTRRRPLLSKQFTKVQKSIPWAPKTTTAD